MSFKFCTHIESLDANFGGSDLWKPLNSLLLTAPHAGDDGAGFLASQ